MSTQTAPTRNNSSDTEEVQLDRAFLNLIYSFDPEDFINRYTKESLKRRGRNPGENISLTSRAITSIANEVDKVGGCPHDAMRSLGINVDSDANRNIYYRVAGSIGYRDAFVTSDLDVIKGVVNHVLSGHTYGETAKKYDMDPNNVADIYIAFALALGVVNFGDETLGEHLKTQRSKEKNYTPATGQTPNTNVPEPDTKVISTVYNESTNKVTVRGRLDYMLLVEVEGLNVPASVGSYFAEENSAVVYHRSGVIVDSDKETTDVGREK